MSSLQSRKCTIRIARRPVERTDYYQSLVPAFQRDKQRQSDNSRRHMETIFGKAFN